MTEEHQQLQFNQEEVFQASNCFTHIQENNQQNIQTVSEVQNIQTMGEVQNIQTVDEVQNIQTVDEVQNIQTVDEVQNIQTVDEVQKLQTINKVQKNNNNQFDLGYGVETFTQQNKQECQNQKKQDWNLKEQSNIMEKNIELDQILQKNYQNRSLQFQQIQQPLLEKDLKNNFSFETPIQQKLNIDSAQINIEKKNNEYKYGQSMNFTQKTDLVQRETLLQETKTQYKNNSIPQTYESSNISRTNDESSSISRTNDESSSISRTNDENSSNSQTNENKNIPQKNNISQTNEEDEDQFGQFQEGEAVSNCLQQTNQNNIQEINDNKLNSKQTKKVDAISDEIRQNQKIKKQEFNNLVNQQIVIENNAQGQQIQNLKIEEIQFNTKTQKHKDKQNSLLDEKLTQFVLKLPDYSFIFKEAFIQQ